jgi:hypothetical protein
VAVPHFLAIEWCWLRRWRSLSFEVLNRVQDDDAAVANASRRLDRFGRKRVSVELQREQATELLQSPVLYLRLTAF